MTKTSQNFASLRDERDEIDIAIADLTAKRAGIEESFGAELDGFMNRLTVLIESALGCGKPKRTWKAKAEVSE